MRVASVLRRAPRAWVEFANALPGTKLAVDVPSGLHADTGVVLNLGRIVQTGPAPAIASDEKLRHAYLGY